MDPSVEVPTSIATRFMPEEVQTSSQVALSGWAASIIRATTGDNAPNSSATHAIQATARRARAVLEGNMTQEPSTARSTLANRR
jgi:hypothetical protein